MIFSSYFWMQLSIQQIVHIGLIKNLMIHCCTLTHPPITLPKSVININQRKTELNMQSASETGQENSSVNKLN